MTSDDIRERIRRYESVGYRTVQFSPAEALEIAEALEAALTGIGLDTEVKCAQGMIHGMAVGARMSEQYFKERVTELEEGGAE